MQEIVFSVQSNMKEAYKVMRLIFTMVFACILAVFLGAKLDSILDTSPWCLLLFLAYAIISSIYLMIRKLGDEHE